MNSNYRRDYAYETTNNNNSLGANYICYLPKSKTYLFLDADNHFHATTNGSSLYYNRLECIGYNDTNIINDVFCHDINLLKDLNYEELQFLLGQQSKLHSYCNDHSLAELFTLTFRPAVSQYERESLESGGMDQFLQPTKPIIVPKPQYSSSILIPLLGFAAFLLTLIVIIK